jgi:hypothetical protein
MGLRTGRSQEWEKVDRLRQLVEAGKITPRASWMKQPPQAPAASVIAMT